MGERREEKRIFLGFFSSAFLYLQNLSFNGVQLRHTVRKSEQEGFSFSLVMGRERERERERERLVSWFLLFWREREVFWVYWWFGVGRNIEAEPGRSS